MNTTLLQRKTLKNLFRPGTGDQPPYLAGREEEKAIFDTALDNLRENQRNPSGHVICYGPRGNGKTTLLRDQQKKLRKQEINTLWLAATALQSKENFLRGIAIESKKNILRIKQIEKIQEWIQRIKRFLPEVGLNILEKINANIQLRWSKEEKERSKYLTLQKIIQKLTEKNRKGEKEPLVLFIDEAHTMDPILGQEILNDSQNEINEGTPFLLVLAGTPQLEDHLQGIKASFWSRSKKIKFGRISEQATRDAITIPLQKYGITVAEDALQIITEQAQGYPYFTQVWGEALCLQLQHNQDTTITTRHVQQGQDYFNKQKDLYYLERYQEIEKRNLLPLAESTAQILIKKNQPINTKFLEYKLQDHTGQDSETIKKGIEAFKKLGYIWSPATRPQYEPGIPSLMTYMVEEQKENTKQAIEEALQEITDENPYTPNTTEQTIAKGLIKALKKERPNPQILLRIQFLRHQYGYINPQEQAQEIAQYCSCKAKLRPEISTLANELKTIQEQLHDQIQKEADKIKN